MATDPSEHAAKDSAELHVPPTFPVGAHIPSFEAYKEVHARSLEDNEGFWAEQANAFLTWDKPFTKVCGGSFEKGDVHWFAGGKLNASYNCLDRHLEKRGDQTAIIFEGDEPTDVRHITYNEAHGEVCKIANMFTYWGIKKGDTVAVYMPMIPELAFVVLACTRIGAIHSVVFAGFSADSLRDRIIDGKSKWVITADQGVRGGRVIPLKNTVDAAIAETPFVEKVFVFERTGAVVPYGDKDIRVKEELPRHRPYCPAVSMDAEDLMFLLYTSGSTGRPKGIAHSTAGYLLYTAMTQKYVFDYQEGDIYCCAADLGWITGHSYIVYGPLINGATTVMFESTPMYPDASRYWDMIQRHKINQFYTAPTAIRALMRFGTAPADKHDLSSLRVLGSVGEPINPEAWRWYYDVIGRGKCAIVDTYWQTETGGHVLTPLPGATPTKAGSATLPFFGLEFALLDAAGNEITGNQVEGVLCIKRPWPSMARTIYGDHARFLSVYMSYKEGYYFTGDGAYRDKDGYYWVTGRVDDVINVSGHRLGSAEVESALVAHEKVAEAATIGFPHEIKGQGIACYAICVDGVESSPELVSELCMQVRKVIGPFATPDHIIITPALPKTRSGKIMRRVLRKIISQETDSLGDITTLADPSVVAALIENVNNMLAEKAAAKAAKAAAKADAKK